MMKFTGIPNFAPELFRRIRLKDPLAGAVLLKGLVQLSEEWGGSGIPSHLQQRSDCRRRGRFAGLTLLSRA